MISFGRKNKKMMWHGDDVLRIALQLKIHKFIVLQGHRTVRKNFSSQLAPSKIEGNESENKLTSKL